MTKKEVFFETALRLIHEKGFKAMTIRSLAEALACDSANIYNYVSSKPAILEHLLFEISGDFHAGIDRILSAELLPEQQVEELIRLHVMLSSEKPFRVGLLVNEWRYLKEERLLAFVKERDSYEQKVSHIFREGIEKGIFRPLDVEVTTQSVLGSLRWQHDYYLKKQQKNKPTNPLKTLTELKQLILPGLMQ